MFGPGMMPQKGMMPPEGFKGSERPPMPDEMEPPSMPEGMEPPVKPQDKKN